MQTRTETTKPAPKKKPAPRDWQCQECGKRMTLATAERCAFGDGCPRCGGSDIDLAVSP